MSNKGLKSLAENTPNFSNQALENSVNDLKIGWFAKSIELDTAITDSTVLTASQKNDLKDEINNVAYLNAGRYINDMLRHSQSIIDGSILPSTDDAVNPEPTTFIDILQLIESIQGLVPSFYDVPAKEKNRGVNNHVGILNGIFLTTEDSTQPVFTSLRESIVFINNAGLATDTAYQNALDDLKNFINGLAGDSTDFQTSLDNRSTAVQTAATNFDTALQAHPYSVKRTQMIADRDAINTQVNLENSNITTAQTYIKTLTDNLAFTSLAQDSDLRSLLSKTAQNASWQNYFNTLETNDNNLNPIYDITSDTEREYVIDEVLASRGLPDVEDFNDLDAVVNKAKQDARIDSKGFDFNTVEKNIELCCVQLGIITFGTVFNQSERLLNNLNKRDRDLVAEELDLNEDANTIS